MPVVPGWKAVAVAMAKGLRQWTSVVRYERGCPRDLTFPFRSKGTCLGPDGKVETVEEYTAFPVGCGCFVKSDKEIGGFCVKGLFVCKSHARGCPINSPRRDYDWREAAGFGACTRGCVWRIRLMRFVHWLVRPL